MDVFDEIICVLRKEFEQIYIFGSRARGDALKYSDLDIIIVDTRFEGIPYYERVSMARSTIREILSANPIDVDIIPLTPEEYEYLRRRRTNIIGDALRRGEIVEA